jgi:hypothetical protein
LPISPFFKAPIPARSNETFPTNYFFKKLLFPPFCTTKWKWQEVFFKWRVATKLMAPQVNPLVPRALAGLKLVMVRSHKKHTKAIKRGKEMSQRLVNGILVLNTIADILGNISKSSFHGECNGILSIGVLLPYH